MKTKTQPTCAACGRTVKRDRCIRSAWTGNRFCFPGECRKTRRAKP